MAEPVTTDIPIEQKSASTGDHVIGRKNEAIRSEIDQNPNISARQIAKNLESRGMRVSMSHIYRQLSNYTRRTTADRDRPWTGTNIGRSAPAGFSMPDTKSYLEKPKEYGGHQRSKEIDAVLDEVGEALDRPRDEPTDSQRSHTMRTSRTKDSRMNRH